MEYFYWCCFVFFIFFSSMTYLHYQFTALVCGHIPDANVLGYKGIETKKPQANYTTVSIFCSLLLLYF